MRAHLPYGERCRLARSLAVPGIACGAHLGETANEFSYRLQLQFGPVDYF